MYVGGAAVLSGSAVYSHVWFISDGQGVQCSVRCGTSLVGVIVRKEGTVELLLGISS